MQPKITVITISYNSASTIEKTIQSVVSQDYANKEYIIIDGASTDSTMDIVRRYADRISYSVSEPDKGVSNAFNKGIAHATGDLIVMINSDDYLLPGVLTKVAQSWDGKSDIWSGNYLVHNPQSGDKHRITPSLHFPVMPFFRRCVHQGRFITRDLYNRIGGYDESIRVPMDLEFLMRATRLGAVFQYENVDVSVFRLGGATSQSIFGKKADYLSIVRKNGGNNLQAHIFYWFMVITQQLKHYLSLTGKDIARVWRYRKVSTGS